MLPILCYHYFAFDRIAEEGVLPHDTAYVSPVELFASHLNLFSERDYRFVTPHLILHKQTGSKPVWLTIDDGHRSILTYAFPLLEHRKIPATVFIVPEWVGKAGYLTWEELRSLLRSGLVTIGSHGLSHRLLTRLGENEIRHELTASKAILEDELSTEIVSFAAPMGGHSAAISQLATESGYRLILTSSYGLNSPVDPIRLERLMMKEPLDSLAALQKQLTGSGLLPLKLRLRNLAKAIRNQIG